jgi:hypothetical protein
MSPMRRVRDAVSWIWIVAFAIFSMSHVPALVAGHATSSPKLLLGCWEQTSPYPLDQIPADQREWGTRTWCFTKHGKMKSVNIACIKGGGCDGWDGGWDYRWRKDMLEIRDWNYDEAGKGMKAWRRCRPEFAGSKRMVLKDCYFSPQEWVKTSSN